MKQRTLVAVAAAVALLAGLAWAQAARKPVNRKCPLKPSIRIDPALTVVYKGKLVGLCCSDCVDKWKKNPDGYFGSVKEDANTPVEPEGSTTVKDTLDSGKTGSYLTVLLFADKSARTQGLIRALSDIAVEPELAKCSYGKVEFKKDSDEARELKVASGGTLLIIDPRESPPKVLKALTAAAPASIIKEIRDGIKKMEKK